MRHSRHDDDLWDDFLSGRFVTKEGLMIKMMFRKRERERERERERKREKEREKKKREKEKEEEFVLKNMLFFERACLGYVLV